MQFINALGLTTVNVNRSGLAVISHAGNMGNTEDNVRRNIDAMYFEGAYDLLSAVPLAAKDGSPDYYFTLTLPYKDFSKIMG